MFTVNQDGGEYDSQPTLHEAIGLMEVVCDLGGSPTTFTVEEEGGDAFASISNRRIVGTFLKQQWGGSKNDQAYPCGEEEFDATDYVLNMEYEDLVQVEDGDYSSDEIGKAHVEWDGPFEVSIEESICEYFGVGSIRRITKDNYVYVRSNVKPAAATERTISVKCDIKVRLSPGASMEEFLNSMEHSFVSNVSGAVVVSSEVVAVSE